MRLKGTIDANVQGGIPKYQEAFLSEAYLSSIEGKDGNVQKLRSLIVSIMQVLDNALDLHGKLAPTEVQPLHKLLVERFNQFRENLNCWGKVRRQKSDSIINTPLPPLPTSVPRNDYDHDDTYSQIKSNGYGNRKSLELSDLHVLQAPPRPAKPTGYEYVNSPEVPPKIIPNSNAPPLPPRFTNDKRLSNPQLFDSPTEGPSVRRIPQKIPYSVVDISLDDSELDFDTELDMVVIQRDSGISTTSHEVVQSIYSVSTNSLPMISTYKQISLRGHQKTSSNPEEYLHQKLLRDDNDSIEELTPPPPALPPKKEYNNFATQNFDDNESFTNSDSTSDSMPLPPIPPIKQQASNHNVINVNCQIVPSCCADIPDNLQSCCVPNQGDDEVERIEECFCDNPPSPMQKSTANHQSCC